MPPRRPAARLKRRGWPSIRRSTCDLAEMQRQQAITAGAAAGAVALVVLLLIPVRRAAIAERRRRKPPFTSITPPVGRRRRRPSRRQASPDHGKLFRAAADLATDFGRVRDLDELTRILGRAADVIDASGLMVWMGTTSGGDLRPVLAHGYSSRDDRAHSAGAALGRQRGGRGLPLRHAADRAVAPGRLDRRRRRADPFRRRLHRRPFRRDPRRRRNLGARPGARRHLRVPPRRRRFATTPAARHAGTSGEPGNTPATQRL